MNTNAINFTTTTSTARVMPLSNFRAWLIVMLFIVGAVGLPAVSHLAGLPVRWLLPMHWPIIIAGAIYGWRGGLIVGCMAPLTNYVLTGYPLPLKLLPMTAELSVYGTLTGWLIERGWNRYAAIGVALIVGRMVFLGSIALMGAMDGFGFWEYAGIAMLPGLIGGVGMVVLIPYIISRVIRE